MLIKKVDKR